MSGACTAPTAAERHLAFATPISINALPLQVVVFDDPAERAQGLMFVSQLADEHGALFVYKEEQRVSFWMKNTLIPLDLLFFNAQGELMSYAPNAQPCKTAICERFTAEGVRYVVEVAGGWIQRQGLLEEPINLTLNVYTR